MDQHGGEQQRGGDRSRSRQVTTCHLNEAVTTAPAWTPVKDAAQPLAIDTEALAASANEEAAAMVQFFVDVAKSDVLDDLGDRDAARRLMEPYLGEP